MKLYTEEQVNRILYYISPLNENYNKIREVIEVLKPIELPSDEEIEEKSKYWNETTNPNMFTFKLAWENGAIRLKKQILNQNK